MINQTLSQLRQLKFNGMENALQLQSEQPGNYDIISFEERIAMMADSEQLERETRKQERLLKAAKYWWVSFYLNTFLLIQSRYIEFL